MSRFIHFYATALLIATAPLSASAYSLVDRIAYRVVQSALQAPSSKLTEQSNITHKGSSVTRGVENPACAQLHPYGAPKAIDPSTTKRGYFTWVSGIHD